MNDPTIFRRVKRIHMVGIGGAGMCGIAEVLLNLGFNVSGCDLIRSEVTERLEVLGARIYEGHAAEHVQGADVLVFSSAVKPENVEVRTAQELRIPTIPRSEMLAELMRMKVGIAVSGTHGKTTTTSMIGSILQEAGRNPTIIVGGKIRSLRTGVKMGTGDLLVVEADEFDRSFLRLSPTLAVITTIEPDHLDTYTDLEGIQDAFVEFANKVPFYGTVVVSGDDANIATILPRLKRTVVTFGFGPDCAYRADQVQHENRTVSFIYNSPGTKKLSVKLSVPGTHNVLNALAAMALAEEMDVPPIQSAKALTAFTGVHRRFEIKGETAGGVIVIDDYAHHPTAVRTTITTARQCWPDRRLVALFEPHLFSRTRDFRREFGEALTEADLVLLADIYPARERPIPGVTSDLIAEEIRRVKAGNVFLLKPESLAEQVRGHLKSGDVLLVMGAGPITRIADELTSGHE